MALKHDLLRCADAFCDATQTPRSTLSYWIARDTRMLGRLASGGDVTLATWEYAMDWLSARWPAGLAWPDGLGVVRPNVPREEMPRRLRRLEHAAQPAEAA